MIGKGGVPVAPSSVLRKARNAARHVAVLVRAVRDREDRRRLRELARTLRDAARAYRDDGLPALVAAAEPLGRSVEPTGALDRALAQADALAAFLRARPFRYCVRRAVLVYRVLRAAGRSPDFVVGAERATGVQGLNGHAWVELDGSPFREADDQASRMTVVYRHPAPSARRGRLDEIPDVPIP
jgi:Transglutaminase-like superfamily